MQVRKCKKRKSNGNHAGRSCAFDLESEPHVCPIVIQDLECPGHMLIEVGICFFHRWTKPNTIHYISAFLQRQWHISKKVSERNGQMLLLQMICSEHGLFLEIAQVIRQMDLTILKGVLESCSSATTLACFIVEV